MKKTDYTNIQALTTRKQWQQALKAVNIPESEYMKFENFADLSDGVDASVKKFRIKNHPDRLKDDKAREQAQEAIYALDGLAEEMKKLDAWYRFELTILRGQADSTFITNPVQDDAPSGTTYSDESAAGAYSYYTEEPQQEVTIDNQKEFGIIGYWVKLVAQIRWGMPKAASKFVKAVRTKVSNPFTRLSISVLSMTALTVPAMYAFLQTSESRGALSLLPYALPLLIILFSSIAATSDDKLVPWLNEQIAGMDTTRKFGQAAIVTLISFVAIQALILGSPILIPTLILAGSLFAGYLARRSSLLFTSWRSILIIGMAFVALFVFTIGAAFTFVAKIISAVFSD